MVKKTLIFILIQLTIFSSEIKMDYLNIYSSEKYDLNRKRYIFDSDNVDVKFQQGNYVVDNVKLKPDLLDVEIILPFYSLNYEEKQFNIEPISFSDEIIGFSNDKYRYFEHKLILPFGEKKMFYSWGKNEEFQFSLLNDYIDLNSENLEIESLNFGVETPKSKIYYKKNESSGGILVNNITNVGNFDGKIEEVGLKYEKSEFIYRKILAELDLTVDDTTAYFITNFSNRYVYANAKIDMDNLEYRQSFTKKFKNSQLKLLNTFGVARDNNSQLSFRQEYYEDVLNLFLFKIKDKVKVDEKELSLSDRNIYYNFLNVSYEKKIGALGIEIQKTIPFVYNRSISPKVQSEYQENGNETDGEQNQGTSQEKDKKKEKIRDLLLSGIKIGIKYEF